MDKKYIIVRTIEERYSIVAKNKKEALLKDIKDPFSVKIIKEKVIVDKVEPVDQLADQKTHNF